MFTLFKRFIREEDGQDFAEYALILGAIGVVAIAVIARYRNELIAAFEAGIMLYFQYCTHVLLSKEQP